jgi:hypothetical protein
MAPESEASICPSTGTRTEACACAACARRKRADDKYRVNIRDAMALLGLVASCVDSHPSQPLGEATWAHVGDATHLRDQLMQIAMGFALRPDGDEQDARRRIEEALCEGDDDVEEALIDAL